MTNVVVVFAVLAATAAAQPAPALPKGVTGVAFGQAQRYKDSTGREACAVPRPLAQPAVFPAGVTEITYTIQLEPVVVKSASAQLLGPGEQTLVPIACSAWIPVPGGLSQTQIGNTVRRSDGRPLVPGMYRVRMTVDGQIADVRFTIR